MADSMIPQLGGQRPENQADMFYRQAVQALINGKRNAATEYLRQCLDLVPEHESAVAMAATLGQVSDRRANAKQRIVAAELAIEMKERSWFEREDILNDLLADIRYFLAEGNIGLAERGLKVILAIAPEHYETNKLAQQISFRRDDRRTAIAWEWTQQLAEDGQHIRARRGARRVLQADPTHEGAKVLAKTYRREVQLGAIIIFLTAALGAAILTYYCRLDMPVGTTLICGGVSAGFVSWLTYLWATANKAPLVIRIVVVMFLGLIGTGTMGAIGILISCIVLILWISGSSKSQSKIQEWPSGLFGYSRRAEAALDRAVEEEIKQRYGT